MPKNIMNNEGQTTDCFEPKIIPTIGRKVYYHARGTSPQVVRSADITEVIDAEKGIISIAVFFPTGLFFLQNVEQGEEPGKWDWMPYQKGQAKKTEEIEKKLEDKPDECPNKVEADHSCDTMKCEEEGEEEE